MLKLRSIENAEGFSLTVPFPVLSTSTAMAGNIMSVTVKVVKMETIHGQILQTIWNVEVSGSGADSVLWDSRGSLSESPIG